MFIKYQALYLVYIMRHDLEKLMTFPRLQCVSGGSRVKQFCLTLQPVLSVNLLYTYKCNCLTSVPFLAVSLQYVLLPTSWPIQSPHICYLFAGFNIQCRLFVMWFVKFSSSALINVNVSHGSELYPLRWGYILIQFHH